MSSLKKKSQNGEQSDEPVNKRSRQSIWDPNVTCTNNVEYTYEELGYTEEVKSTFKSKHESQSLKQIICGIGEIEDITLDIKKYLLYPAFREALLKLLQDIEEIANNKEKRSRWILIHGMPSVGKSALSECLAYFLALHAGGEVVHHNALNHTAQCDNHRLTKRIGKASAKEYVIFDQVNTHSLIPHEIAEYVRGRWDSLKYRIPVIMFTSGHYSPTEDWLTLEKTGELHYKVVNMQIDADCVGKMKKKHCVPEGATSNEDLLQVTTSYGRMVTCLSRLIASDPRANANVLRQTLFPGPDLHRILRETNIHFIWLAWYHLIANGLPTLANITEDHCKLEPYHVEYLAYLITDVEDPTDRGINALLKEMEISGDPFYEKNGYSEFKSDSYCYKFVNKEHLHAALEVAIQAQSGLSLEEKLTIMVGAYIELSERGESHFQYLRGRLFELIINGICEKLESITSCQFGMLYVNKILFSLVSHRVPVSTEEELCHVPRDMHSASDEKEMTFFCQLNVPGKRAFEGYDYAYMKTMREEDRIVVRELQLFRVTVNPEGMSVEKKLIMTDVLERIKRLLIDESLIEESHADNVVTPYFVHPGEGDRKVDLPCKDSEIRQEVKILGFPQTYFKIPRNGTRSLDS